MDEQADTALAPALAGHRRLEDVLAAGVHGQGDDVEVEPAGGHGTPVPVVAAQVEQQAGGPVVGVGRGLGSAEDHQAGRIGEPDTVLAVGQGRGLGARGLIVAGLGGGRGAAAGAGPGPVVEEGQGGVGAGCADQGGLAEQVQVDAAKGREGPGDLGELVLGEGLALGEGRHVRERGLEAIVGVGIQVLGGPVGQFGGRGGGLEQRGQGAALVLGEAGESCGVLVLPTGRGLVAGGIVEGLEGWDQVLGAGRGHGGVGLGVGAQAEGDQVQGGGLGSGQPGDLVQGTCGGQVRVGRGAGVQVQGVDGGGPGGQGGLGLGHRPGAEQVGGGQGGRALGGQQLGGEGGRGVQAADLPVELGGQGCPGGREQAVDLTEGIGTGQVPELGGQGHGRCRVHAPADQVAEQVVERLDPVSILLIGFHGRQGVEHGGGLRGLLVGHLGGVAAGLALGLSGFELGEDLVGGIQEQQRGLQRLGHVHRVGDLLEPRGRGVQVAGQGAGLASHGLEPGAVLVGQPVQSLALEHGRLGVGQEELGQGSLEVLGDLTGLVQGLVQVGLALVAMDDEEPLTQGMLEGIVGRGLGQRQGLDREVPGPSGVQQGLAGQGEVALGSRLGVLVLTGRRGCVGHAGGLLAGRTVEQIGQGPGADQGAKGGGQGDGESQEDDDQLGATLLTVCSWLVRAHRVTS